MKKVNSSAARLLKKLWESESMPSDIEHEFVQATSGKFKPMQRVRVARDHEFNRACAAYPHVGIEGNVVVNERYIKHVGDGKLVARYRPYRVPKGKLAVRFSSKALGYEDNRNKPFTILFVDENALEPARPA